MKNKLFSEFSIGDLKLKNRIVMAPMCTCECKNKDGLINDFHMVHYGSRAIGQVGIINIEATAIEERGKITEYDLALFNDTQANKLKDLVSMIHSFDCKVGIQLAHAGRKGYDNENLISSSEIAFSNEYGKPKALSLNEIDKIIDKFVYSATLAKNSGVDMIEIHAAHGYLINQFISKLVNTRTDEYGGNLENRFRFLKRIILGIKSVFNGSLWVRISVDEYDDNGTSMEEFLKMCQWMKELGVDVIDVSSGGVIDVKPKDIYAGYQVKKASIIKEKVGINVAVVGFLDDEKLCEYLLKNDNTDLICLGRPLLFNPHWAYKAAKNLREDEFSYYNNAYERGKNI